jgi:plastocyanin
MPGRAKLGRAFHLMTTTMTWKFNMTTCNSSLVTLACLALSLGAVSLGGCATTAHGPQDPIEFSIAPSVRTVHVGEPVTLTTRSANTVGYETSVDWQTTGGELTTQQRQHIAQIKFDQPGTYQVTATLHMKNQPDYSDTVDFVVKPKE